MNNSNKFKKLALFIFLFGILLINFTDATSFSDCEVYGNCKPTVSGNTYINNTNISITNNYNNVTQINNITTPMDYTNLALTNQSNSFSGNQTTNSWWNGLFNWTVLNNWFGWNGATLSFNESKLNATIDARTIPFNNTNVAMTNQTNTFTQSNTINQNLSVLQKITSDRLVQTSYLTKSWNLGNFPANSNYTLGNLTMPEGFSKSFKVTINSYCGMKEIYYYMYSTTRYRAIKYYSMQEPCIFNQDVAIYEPSTQPNGVVIQVQNRDPTQINYRTTVKLESYTNGADFDSLASNYAITPTAVTNGTTMFYNENVMGIFKTTNSSGSNGLYVDASGCVGIGSACQQTGSYRLDVNVPTVFRQNTVYAGNFQQSAADASFVGLTSSNTNPYTMILERGRPTIGNVSNGDVLSSIISRGYNILNDFKEAGIIKVTVDGVTNGTSMPGRMSFWTTPVGSYVALERMTIKNDGNVGIGTISPLFPLTVMNNISDGTNIISIWASSNISATGYITRTSVFDKTKIPEDYIKDASAYLTTNSKGVQDINHKAFYGYINYTATDYSKPVINYKEECEPKQNINGTIFDKDGKTIEECKTIPTTTYPFTKIEEGVDLGKEIDVLRQAVYNLIQENKNLTARVEYLENIK